MKSSMEVETAVSEKVGFPVKLYEKLLSGSGNIFFSPYSIYSAMSMLLLGCRGNSESELVKLLGAHESIHEKNSQIRESLSKVVEGIEMTTANRLFVEKSYNLVEKFVSECSKYYKSEVMELDFQQSAEDSRKHINEWVEKQTRDKIKDLIAQGDVDASTKAVLVNAIYFKGKWEYEFDKKYTAKKNFHISRLESTEVDMMSQKRGFRFAKSKSLEAKMLELDYQGEKVSMVIVLPSDTLGLTKVEKNFTAQHLDELSRYSITVNVMVPKFRMEYQCGLKETCKKLGVESIFGHDADLSGISGAKDLFVSTIIHKAFVEVNEEGTEATAATAVIMTKKRSIKPPEIEEFICDHPFLFLIRYKPTNTILFIGRYLGPEN